MADERMIPVTNENFWSMSSAERLAFSEGVDAQLKADQAQLDKAKPIIGKEVFTKIRKASQGEPSVFDWVLDELEIQWLYELVRQKHRLDRPDKEKIRGVLQKVANVGGTGAIVKYSHLQTYLGIKAQEILALFDEEEIRKQERERIMKIFASFGKIQLKKPLSGKEFEALFD